MAVTDAITGPAVGTFEDAAGQTINYTFTTEFSNTGHSGTDVSGFGVQSAGIAEGISGYTFDNGAGGGARGITLQIGGLTDLSDAIDISINGVDVNLADMVANGEVTILTGTDRPVEFQSYDSTQDLSLNSDGDIVADQPADFSDDDAFEEIIFLSFRDEIRTIDIRNNDPTPDDSGPGNNSILTDIYINDAVICFGADTMIETPGGERQVNTLRAGDLVQTVDGRHLPIRWIGYRTINNVEMAINPRLCPVQISTGALGGGLPRQPLTLSRQHRLLVSSAIVRRMFGCDEVFITAAKLELIEAVSINTSSQTMTYVHFLLDEHAVVLANGYPCETLLPGAAPDLVALPVSDDKGADSEQALADEPCFPVAKVKMQMTLVERHIKNDKPFFAPERDVLPVHVQKELGIRGDGVTRH